MYIAAEVCFRLTLYFFYQGTVSAIKFRKRLSKFKVTTALPKKFGSKGFVTAVKVTKIWRSSGESNKLWYVYPIWGTPGHAPEKGNWLYQNQIKSSRLSYNFGENCTTRYTWIQIPKNVFQTLVRLVVIDMACRKANWESQKLSPW